MTVYGLLCALALALMLAAARKNTRFDVWIRLSVAAIFLALIGSRLLFSLASLVMGDMTTPLQILYAWDGGASMSGAFAGIVLAAFLVERHCKVPHGFLMDQLALGMPLALIVARLAEIPTGMGMGRQVDTPWLQWLGSFTDECHPVFVYEAVWAIVIGISLLLYLRRNRHPGDMLLTFMTLYGSAQMFFESLRDDFHMVIYYIRINQIAGLIMVLIPFLIWILRLSKHDRKRNDFIFPCLVMVVAIVLCIYQEFQVDSNPNLLKEYAIMAAGVSVLGTQTILIRNKANKE
ncbi:MAG: prolipoprotein diacylglyceryl transferase [Clostridia bacterium]|nr:prolipoprotein diacylglyceryl transferase [Clostridia bacterium]